jgi:hypothetical protein
MNKGNGIRWRILRASFISVLDIDDSELKELAGQFHTLFFNPMDFFYFLYYFVPQLCRIDLQCSLPTAFLCLVALL